MNAAQTRVLGSFRRVTAFLTGLPPGTGLGDVSAPLTELQGIVTQLSTSVVGQDKGQRLKKAATQRKTSVRQTLRVHHMQPIAAMAKALLHIPGGYDKALLMPAKGIRTEALVGAAGAMASAMQPYAPLFIQNGLAANFVALLTAVAAELQATVATQAQSTVNHVTATAAVRTGLARGHVIVKLLDAIVTPALALDPPLLHAWKSAKGTHKAVVATVPANNVPGAPATPTTGGTTAPATPPATPAPAPTTATGAAPSASAPAAPSGSAPATPTTTVPAVSGTAAPAPTTAAPAGTASAPTTAAPAATASAPATGGAGTAATG
jgi:hypothetical protein